MSSPTPQQKKQASALTTRDFTEDPRVQAYVKQVQDQFNNGGSDSHGTSDGGTGSHGTNGGGTGGQGTGNGSNSSTPHYVSDVLDADGNQYVNLVQKGGGVLGIALVGYTYILEKAGIRFLKLAGTSAGAINTSLMTIIGNKQDAKSEDIIQILCDLNFFSFVDGHPAARWLIKNFITHENFADRVTRIAKLLGFSIAILVIASFVFMGLRARFHELPIFVILTRLAFTLTGLILLAAGVFTMYVSNLMTRLKNAGFGINPGDAFYDWIKGIFTSKGVHTVEDLQAKAKTHPPFHLRVPHPAGVDDLEGDVTFITAELVTQNKIQFPGMYNLFRTPADKPVHPAGFVRASMSIPVFFESYMIPDIDCKNDDIKQAWKDTFFELDPPSTARFIDGGVLSNFPINLFYNPNVATPRMPTFGIDLDDSDPADNTKNPFSWGGLGYFGRVFNTIRFYYDKDFLIKNHMYELGVGKIPLRGFKWLNFFLTDSDKKEMFVKGAEAAAKFLATFDWDQYKKDQTNDRKQLAK